MRAVQEPPTPRRSKIGAIERSPPDVQSSPCRVFTGPSWDQIFGGSSLRRRPLANSYQHVNSKEITTRVDCSHVADQLRNLWRGIILSDCRDISSQRFMSLAVARSLCVRCGPMWADVAGHAPTSGEIWSSFGVKNYPPFLRL